MHALHAMRVKEKRSTQIRYSDWNELLNHNNFHVYITRITMLRVQ